MTPARHYQLLLPAATTVAFVSAGAAGAAGKGEAARVLGLLGATLLLVSGISATIVGYSRSG